MFRENIGPASLIALLALTFSPLHAIGVVPSYKYVSFDIPTAYLINSSYANDSGEVVGTARDVSGYPHGFILSGASFTIIDVPWNAQGTVITGINNSGDIVGFSMNPHHGFERTAAGAFIEIDSPSATMGGATFPFGINDGGEIVGYYTIGTIIPDNHGFLYAVRPVGGCIHVRVVDQFPAR